MKPLNLVDVQVYVESNIGTFHKKRLEKLAKLKLLTVLKRKNPYLFRAKYTTIESVVRGILDAYLSSQEETLFGDFLEGVAIFVGEQVHNGYKPSTDDFTGIDLIFEQDQRLYIVEIKSGPNWGNSSQINKMLDNFRTAQVKLNEQYPEHEIIAVNGCAYGRNKQHSQRDGAYWKLCGQDFWQFLSGDEQLYTQIIEPLGNQVKERNKNFNEEYADIINRFTVQFVKNFSNADDSINWEKLVQFVSERDAETDYPF